MTTYAVIGSRFPADPVMVRRQVRVFVGHLDDADSIVTGDARGVDSWAAGAARKRGIPVEAVPAEWEKYGRRAGMLRNPVIVGKADVVIAFWDGSSPGTKNGLDHAKRQGKPRVVVWADAVS